MIDQELLPKFLCVGGAKCGTTSLYEYLKQHPEIFLPAQKELHFFSYPELSQNTNGPGMKHVLKDLIKDKGGYYKQYRTSDKNKVSGDISPSYLIYPKSIERIKKMLGDPKIIIMLRNPVERVYSQYLHLRRAAREDLTFEDALEAENARIDAGWGDMWHYKSSGFYSKYVSSYVDAFSIDNVHIILMDDLKSDPKRIISSVFDFIGVDSSIEVNLGEEYNKSALPRSKFIARMTEANYFTSIAKKVIPRNLGASIKRKVQNLNLGDKPIMNTETLENLKQFYKDDIRELEAIIERKTGW